MNRLRDIDRERTFRALWLAASRRGGIAEPEALAVMGDRAHREGLLRAALRAGHLIECVRHEPDGRTETRYFSLGGRP